MNRRLSTASAPSAVLLLLVTLGCGKESTVIECQPACPKGTHCADSGCVLDGEAADLAVAGFDLASTSTCAPACSGATPICRNGACAGCATDSDCAAGHVCKASGQTALCVPGCADDSRCGGGSMKCCGGGCADTGTDPGNCGACGTNCIIDHGAASCAGGHCTLGACAAGWADCNANSADGCEVSLRSDAGNCLGCGMVCSFANAVAGCSDGCYVSACQFGWDDCNGDDKDGCEASVLGDSRNCGACGNACAVPPHAKVNCVNAACQLTTCDAGYNDCDGMLANGCEAATGTDANNCGACGNKCGQGLICAQGLCTCPQCNLPNAKSTCVNLKCAVASCNINWGDCDGLPQNGCEQDLTSDARNCGACSKVCAQGLVCTNGSCTCPNCMLPNARTACLNNMCVLDSCFQGFGNCDGNPANGCEVDLSSDASNCGACGMVCPKNLPVCQIGACGNCLMTLSGIGGNDFTIAFSMKTQSNQLSTILGQRPACDRGMMWDARMNGGHLGFEFDDTINYASVTSVGTVNDGNVHAILVRRAGGIVTISIDNKQDAMVNAPAKFGMLPALYIATGGICEGKDGTVPLNGTVTNVCLSSP